jgi:hypothetical protein
MVCSGETASLQCYFNVTHNECNEDFFSFQTCSLTSFFVTVILLVVACLVFRIFSASSQHHLLSQFRSQWVVLCQNSYKKAQYFDVMNIIH